MSEALAADFREKMRVNENRIEEIMTLFWQYMDTLDLENNAVCPLEDAINTVLVKLQGQKQEIDIKEVEEIIYKKLKTKKFIYSIVEGKQGEKYIKVTRNYWQEKNRINDKAKKTEAYETFQKFIKKVEKCLINLKEQGKEITRENLENQFIRNEGEEDKIWRKLAIEKVIENFMRERNNTER